MLYFTGEEADKLMDGQVGLYAWHHEGMHALYVFLVI